MIRQARVQDSQAVHGLLWRARDRIPLPDRFDTPAMLAVVRRWCRFRHVWVWDQAGEIAAVVIMLVSEIKYLVVAPEHQGMGIAAAMIDLAKDRARRRSWRYLIVRANPADDRVVALLSKQDFRLKQSASPAEPGGWRQYHWPRHPRYAAALVRG